MAITESYKQLFQGTIAAGATTYYTVPALTQTIVKHISIVNPSGADAWVKLWTSGTTDADLVLPQVSIDAGGWSEFDGTMTLSAGDIVAAQSQTAGVLTMTIHGTELVTS